MDEMMEKKYISVDQLWRCETCFYMGSNGECRSDCDAGEAYRPAYNKFGFSDVAPVVHGRWIDKYNDCCCAECSVCGEFYETTDQDRVTADSFRLFCRFYKFCPDCGAKMDAVAADNADRCVCCGDVIPEGRQVCPACEGGTNART